MASFNRRLIFWIIKAYIKRWGKIILLSFVVGLVFFFVLKQFLFSAFLTLTSENKQLIGTVGSYTVNSIPSPILENLSEGLVHMGEDGVVTPAIASSWKISDSGKVYSFTLRKNIHFTDGTLLTSKEISLNYTDVKIERPNLSTIVFRLKENYAPFLLTVSRPIFRKGFVGVGPYVMKNVKLNGSFIESISMKKKDGSHTLVYQFYPTQDALKIAFALGEVSVIGGVNSLTFDHTSFDKFANVTVKNSIRRDILVALFYNTTDSDLSNKELRDGLSYAVPSHFAQGERAYSSISPISWAYSRINIHTEDVGHAAVLLDAAGGVKKLPTFVISSLAKYEDVAKIIQKSWARVGIKTKIVIVDSIPQRFQVFLGDFSVSKDPDQYSLWHSFQTDNITNFNTDKRIDKLLEDGRQTVNQSDRQKIYADFQKYLQDEQPATFLYFSNNYVITRK